jgi:ABC-type antimicrobial peptide transport system permease subunit
LTQARVGGQVAWSIGWLGLVLATVGAYGVFAYSVEERRREVGIRIALGAQSQQIIKFVLRTTQTTVGIGLTLGLVLSSVTAPVLGAYLYGLSPFDPLAYFQGVFILSLAALLATWVPARRALRVDPAVTLRAE